MAPSSAGRHRPNPKALPCSSTSKLARSVIVIGSRIVPNKTPPMKTLLYLVLLAAVACSSTSCTIAGKRMRRGLAAVPMAANGQIDYAALATLANSKAAERAASFDVFLVQLGGKVDFNDGMGMTVVADNEASWQHFLQAAGLAVSAWSAASQAAAKFAHDKFVAGEITKREFNTQMAALQAQELALKGEVTNGLINAGHAVPAPQL
jgi:hypothetical protein